MWFRKLQILMILWTRSVVHADGLPPYCCLSYSSFSFHFRFQFTHTQLEYLDTDDVIIFEKKHCDDNLELATCEDYFKDLLYRVEVVFIDKSNPNDAGFTLELSQRMNYEQMANAVGHKMNVDPNTIQFFRVQK